MTDLGIVVQTLRELGITRTEAEVYLATLQEAGGGPVSGYRVAQSVGKDPANLSKTLASLERLGAVRTIQDKPRLYVPVPPKDFTDKLLADLKNNQARVLEQLSQLQTATPRGIPMALHDQHQTLQKSAQLLTQCRSELLLFAAREVLEKLGTSLEALAASAEVSVKILCLEKLGWSGLQEKVIDLPVGFADPQPVLWLQMVIDRKTWVVASFPSASAEFSPCGWWSEDPQVAMIMGASLASAMDSNVELAIEIPPVETTNVEPVSVFQADPVKVENDLHEEAETTTEAKTEIAFPQTVEALEEDEDDDGIQFIIRHDDDDSDKKKP